MGKQKNNNRRQQKPSFFEQQIQRNGTGFLNKMNAFEVRKNALAVFKDLANCNVRTDQIEEYFNVPDFTYNLYLSAYDNFIYRQYMYIGLVNNPQYNYDGEMQKVAADIYEQMGAYNSLVLHLNNILQNITTYGGVYTRFYLDQLIADLRWKRNAFNGFFITIEKDNDGYIKKRRQQINDQRNSDSNERGFFDKPFKNNM